MTRTLRPVGRTRSLIIAAVLDGAARGLPPSLRDLARLTGTTVNNIEGHLKALRRAGLVGWQRGLKRTLVPTCR